MCLLLLTKFVLVTAGADILLMPSRFEPCGLNQLYAMAYGTVPVVHAVGGLRDTVTPFNPFENAGTGWTFERAEAEHMRGACTNALDTYRKYRDSFVALQKRGMAQDLSWDHAAEIYEGELCPVEQCWGFGCGFKNGTAGRFWLPPAYVLAD